MFEEQEAIDQSGGFARPCPCFDHQMDIGIMMFNLVLFFIKRTFGTEITPKLWIIDPAVIESNWGTDPFLAIGNFIGFQKLYFYSLLPHRPLFKRLERIHGKKKYFYSL